MEVFAVLLNATASKTPWFRTADQHIADGLALWSVVGQIWATWYLLGNLALTPLLIDASRLLLIWAALSAHPRTSRNMYGQSLAVALAARLARSSCLFLLAVALASSLTPSSLIIAKTVNPHPLDSPRTFVLIYKNQPVTYSI